MVTISKFIEKSLSDCRAFTDFSFWPNSRQGQRSERQQTMLTCTKSRPR